MRNQKQKKIKKVTVLIAALGCTAVLTGSFPMAAANESLDQQDIPGNVQVLTLEDDLNQDEQDVRALVEAFGKALQKVSLLAPKEVVAKSIKEHYGDYVTPELLQKWKNDPQSAPGRLVSSPWPDRIDILELEISDENEYTIYGEVIEVTSMELANGGVAAKYPVVIVARKVNGQWFISSVTAGEYV